MYLLKKVLINTDLLTIHITIFVKISIYDSPEGVTPKSVISKIADQDFASPNPGNLYFFFFLLESR